MRNAINKKIDAKLKRLLELGEDKDQIKSRISLIDRQNFRSAATRELLKKAVWIVINHIHNYLAGTNNI